MQFEARVSKRLSCTSGTARKWRNEATTKCAICDGPIVFFLTKCTIHADFLFFTTYNNNKNESEACEL